MHHLRFRLGVALVASGLCRAVALADAPTTQPRLAPATRPAIVLEAEDAEPHRVLYSTTRPGYSGNGYVTGFVENDSHLLFHANSAAGGVYQVDIRYSSSAPKGYGLVVNGVERDDAFPATGDAFGTHSAGKVFLRPGENEIDVRRGWGYFDIDRIELFPTEVTTMQKPPATLVNPNATPAARALMQRLVDGYGRYTLSGVFGEGDAALVQQHAGVLPAVVGADLIEHSPSRRAHGSKAEPTSQELIKLAKSGAILTVMWHWNAPAGLIDNPHLQVNGQAVDASWYKGFYTNASTFDVADALAHPDGQNHRLLLRDLDVIAAQLEKLSDAGVPVLWRPLHEADGGWFWWGAKGPSAFKQLWSLMYDRFTHYHHLNNLIWVYTGSTQFDWYPPDNQFDVIGVDFYPPDPHDPDSALWDALQARYGSTKLLTMSEVGGVPDVEAMAQLGVRWAYFNTWFGMMSPLTTDPERFNALYHSPQLMNRPEKVIP